MKNILTLVLITLSLTACLQNQHDNRAIDIRMLPKYGGVEKNKEQKEADQKFVDNMLRQDIYKNNHRLASDDLIQKGFGYLYQNDLKTAMYRFNQAYLIDSTNSNIYWGYGGFYWMQSEFEKAREQFETGLEEDPDNPNLLTDLATYYLKQCEDNQNNSVVAKQHLDQSIELLNKSYKIDSNNQNTLYKLSTSYLLKNDCEKAWKFYYECKQAGGQPITKEYTRHLENICNKGE